MVQLMIFFTNRDLEEMKEKECELSIIQDLESTNSKFGILRCLDFKKQYGYVPTGFEIIEYNEEYEEVIEDTRYFFNATIINKDNCTNDIGWKRMFKDFPHIKEYIYVNNNFCIPYNEETDKIININI